VSVIDVEHRRELAVVAAGQQPAKVQLAPDGRTLVVSNRGDGSISIYTLSEDARHPLELRATIGGCPGAGDLAILPDSTKVFVACSAGHQVMSVALAQPTDSFAVKQNGELARDQQLALLDVGKTPMQLALKPDGGEIFVSNYDGDSISEIATQADEVGGTYFIGSKPIYGLVSDDDSTLWVSNFGSDAVTAYSIDDGRIDSVVRTGAAPTALAFTSAGHLLLATDSRSGDVSLVRTQAHDQYATRSLFTLLPSGPQPGAIAVKSFLLK
jgi:DNA-binding beta-propeller fold protein YncE